MIKANAGTPGVAFKAANGNLSAITLLDTRPTNPTSRAWSILRFPSNLASAPAVTNSTANPATFTPPQTLSVYVVWLHRVETDASENNDYLAIGVPDALGRMIPCAGLNSALLTFAEGWAGGLVAGWQLLEQSMRDAYNGAIANAADIDTLQTDVTNIQTDVADLTTTIGEMPPFDQKVRVLYIASTIVNPDYNHIEVDTTAGAVTLTILGSSTQPSGKFFEIVHVLGGNPVLLDKQIGHEADVIDGVVPYHGGITLVNDAAGNWFGQNSWCSLYGIQVPNDGAIFCPATQIIVGTSGGQINIGDSGDTSAVKLVSNDIVSIGVGGNFDSLTVDKSGASIILTGAENDLKLSSTLTITLDLGGTKLGAYALESGYPKFTLDSARPGYIFETSANSQLLAFKALGTGCYVSFTTKLGSYFVADGVSSLSVEKTVISLFSSGGAASGGDKIIYLANRTTAPTSNPTGGGIIYEEAGALLHRGTGGTITTIAPA